MNYHLTLKSDNEKTGPIPVSTTSNDTCPSTCPLKAKGCYGKTTALRFHWSKVNQGDKRVIDLDTLCEKIDKLPLGQLWRHNQAGDLPGIDTDIDAEKLDKLVKANQGKKGYTYTHKPVLNNEKNRKAVKQANDNGFVINLSANNLNEADELKALDIGPVCTLLPIGTAKLVKTPKGNKVVACPAQYKDNVSCATCGLCAIKDRQVIIGFEAHSISKKTVDLIAKG